MSDDTSPPPQAFTAAAETAHGRAGRDLVAAVAAGLVLGIICLVSLFTVKWLFAVVAGVALVIAVQEFRVAMKQRGITIDAMTLFAGVVALSVAAYFGGLAWLAMGFGVLVLALVFRRLRGGTEGYVRDVTASVFVAAYLPFMVGFVMLMLRADNGAERVLTFILLTVCSDIGGYAAGVLFGKHPIAASISPKKSWEGLVGSLVLQSVAGALLFVFLFDAPWWQGVVTGIVLTAVATLGDFAESAVKRDLGVKDMGTIVPGHGGMMDRLDSLVPNAFVAWLLLTLFLGASS